VTTAQLGLWLKKKVSLVRAMSNTAIAIREAMTCLSAAPADHAALEEARTIFDALGKTLIISEELMLPATALTGCGIAFFLRAIRAASQGGTQIGFHSEEALLMAAQTARGAASLLLGAQSHPESEIDKVTTPCGCTIEGLNEMEHHGFSSAMITGIVTSNNKAARLLKKQ
jgi:pyrroline-5-carboxylate reductase